MSPPDALVYTTEDGWANEIRHFPGEGEPVLLVHGMGANHYNFDYRPEVSVAAYLQEEGWDVWVVELRGDPGSIAPSRAASRDYAFDHHARYDLPAAVDAVLEATGRDELYWVGHSMGGMLLYTALSNYPEKIAAGVAISSPGTFIEVSPGSGLLVPLRGLFRGRGKVNMAGPAKLMAPLGKTNLLIGRLGTPKNLDGALLKGMARRAMVNVSHGTAYQGLTWVRERSFVSLEGEPWLTPLDDTPLLTFGGTNDKVVHHLDVAETCRAFEDCTYVELSISNGYSFDYGHIDPVVGITARDEVYPVVGAFLASHLPDEAVASSAPSVD
jgi:pimeloyl-ACP methyl ester carboxylesterase